MQPRSQNPKTDESLVHWARGAYQDARVAKRMQGRILLTLRNHTDLRVHAPTGTNKIDLLVKVQISFWDKVTQVWGDMLDNFNNREWVPLLWLKDYEWFHLCTVRDIRHPDLREDTLGEIVWVTGTGLEGLNFFDLERAATRFLVSKGILANVTYQDFPPELY